MVNNVSCLNANAKVACFFLLCKYYTKKKQTDENLTRLPHYLVNIILPDFSLSL